MTNVASDEKGKKNVEGLPKVHMDVGKKKKKCITLK